MPRYRQYIDTDVLTEARKRLHHIYDHHDKVIVSFSGGKDSLAVLHLVKEVAEERGEMPVKAVFRDEEVIAFQVIEFMEEHLHLDWLDLEWWAIPLQSHKFVLNAIEDYVQWDPNREHIRPIPPWALTETDLGLEPGTVSSQYTVDALTARDVKGKVALVTGVRAAESLQRYRSAVNKLNENYISVSPASKRVSVCRPLFDWQQNDVFRYFYDNGIKYCPVYDGQVWASNPLRVCSALTTEAAKDLSKYKVFAPDLYERILEIWPDMALQERYYRELDRESEDTRYAESWETIREWIDKTLTDRAQHKKAVTEWKAARIRAANDPDAYPLRYVLRQFVTQGGKRTIQPLSPKAAAPWLKTS